MPFGTLNSNHACLSSHVFPNRTYRSCCGFLCLLLLWWDERSDGKGTTTHMIGCGPNPAVTVTFFLSYIMLSTFMLINIFVAMIVDSVSAHYEVGRRPPAIVYGIV